MKAAAKKPVATKPPAAKTSAGKSADSNANIRKAARKPKDPKGGKG
jgi:hypothetical protein